MQSPAELLRLIHNLIKLGTVADIDLSAARCRVAIGDLLTAWLPWLTARAGESNTWDPPSIGEQVVILSPGGDLACGIVLAGLYQTSRPAPSDKASEWRREFPDGSWVAYDAATHELAVSSIATVKITAADGLQILGVTTIDGNTTINGTVDFNGSSVKHNGTNIGGTHRHGLVQSGPDISGDPQ